MRTVVSTRHVDDGELATVLAPKETLVLERSAGDGAFELVEGPFTHYRRTVVVSPVPEPDGRHEVTETTEWRFAIPLWHGLFDLLFRGSLKRPAEPGKTPWWMPPDRMDARASEVLSLLCFFSVIAGYLGVLLSQLNAYFRAEYGASLTEVADVQIAVRIGAFLSLIVVALADRSGRKRMLLISTYLAIALAATGALAPSLAWLGVSQSFARAFSAAIALIVLIMVVEEMPAGARAFAVSLVTMTSALGAGGVVLFLFVAGSAPNAWRIFFVVPFIMVVPAMRLGRKLPETRRFEVFEQREDELGHSPLDEAVAVDARSERLRRFAMIGAVGLFFNVFLAPTAANLIEYLKNEQGFSEIALSGFQVLTNLPGGIAIVVGGRMADKYGRRLIGSIGVIGGASFTIAMYLAGGIWIWIFSTLATLTGALVIPALGVYQSEMFSTGTRGRANGGLNLLAVMGSAIGLKAAGMLADRVFDGHIGPAIAVLGIAPLIVAIIVITCYPETVHKELEELNPEDLPPPTGEDLEALDAWHEQHEAELHEHHQHP